MNWADLLKIDDNCPVDHHMVRNARITPQTLGEDLDRAKMMVQGNFGNVQHQQIHFSPDDYIKKFNMKSTDAKEAAKKDRDEYAKWMRQNGWTVKSWVLRNQIVQGSYVYDSYYIDADHPGR